MKRHRDHNGKRFSPTSGPSEIRLSNCGAASISTKFRNRIVDELVLGAIIEEENPKSPLEFCIPIRFHIGF